MVSYLVYSDPIQPVLMNINSIELSVLTGMTLDDITHTLKAHGMLKSKQSAHGNCWAVIDKAKLAIYRAQYANANKTRLKAQSDLLRWSPFLIKRHSSLLNDHPSLVEQSNNNTDHDPDRDNSASDTNKQTDDNNSNNVVTSTEEDTPNNHPIELMDNAVNTTNTSDNMDTAAIESKILHIPLHP
jgi:hypothetical protein